LHVSDVVDRAAFAFGCEQVFAVADVLERIR
jgi:hypothetical protein